eukprot:7965375-Ditylum_brightwellii.AAC.1
MEKEATDEADKKKVWSFINVSNYLTTPDMVHSLIPSFRQITLLSCDTCYEEALWWIGGFY